MASHEYRNEMAFSTSSAGAIMYTVMDCERLTSMQDRYVGDVGDFGKYALLRRLCSCPTEKVVRLGVVWCLFPDEGHNNDGRHTSYLQAREFAELDPELFSVLSRIIKTGTRRISSVTNAAILPPSTVFYEAPLSPAPVGPLLRNERLRHRSNWLESCLTVMADRDLLFFDPDNGLEVASIPKHHSLAGKYIYWDELMPFWNRGQTLLIYHHLNRTKPAARQVDELASRFRARLKGASIKPLIFRRGSCRVFWLVHHGCTLGRVLENRAIDMLHEGWSKHFRPFGWPHNDHAGADAR